MITLLKRHICKDINRNLKYNDTGLSTIREEYMVHNFDITEIL
jgi:hypothetical protein